MIQILLILLALTISYQAGKYFGMKKGANIAKKFYRDFLEDLKK